MQTFDIVRFVEAFRVVFDHVSGRISSRRHGSVQRPIFDQLGGTSASNVDPIAAKSRRTSAEIAAAEYCPASILELRTLLGATGSSGGSIQRKNRYPSGRGHRN